MDSYSIKRGVRREKSFLMTKNKIIILNVVFSLFIGFEIQGQTPQGFDFQEQEQDTIINLLHKQISGRGRDIEGLRRNLQLYPMYVDAIDSNGNSLLQVAVRGNDIEAVDVLLSLDADVNFQHIENKGNTPLHYSRHPAITQRLIDHGALPNILNVDKFSPLLRHVTRSGLTAENIHILLKTGARTNIVSPKRSTALHLLFVFSEDYRNPRISRDPSYREWLDKTRLEIAKDLIDHGVDVKAVDDYGFTALHYAARMGHRSY